MANRRYVYQFDYHPIPTKTEQAKTLKPDVMILAEEFWEPSTQPLPQALEELLALGYKVKTKLDGFFILEK